MNDPEVPFGERRRRSEALDGPVWTPCRACGEPITLRLERLELIQNRVLHRCPLCDAFSLIRSTDLHLLLERGIRVDGDSQ